MKINFKNLGIVVLIATPLGVLVGAIDFLFHVGNFVMFLLSMFVGAFIGWLTSGKWPIIEQ